MVIWDLLSKNNNIGYDWIIKIDSENLEIRKMVHFKN